MVLVVANLVVLADWTSEVSKKYLIESKGSSFVPSSFSHKRSVIGGKLDNSKMQFIIPGAPIHFRPD